MDKKHILVVENSAIISLDLKFMCRQIGHICSSISYDDNAVKKVKEIKPDLILMDIDIKDNAIFFSKAKEICDEFRIPIIFFTTTPPDFYKNNPLKNRCLFQSFPINEDKLISVIESLLDTYKNP